MDSHYENNNLVIVDWDGENDLDDPFNWPRWKKWSIISLALLASFTSSMNGTILSVAHTAINADFGISDASIPNSYWPTTSWGVGGALFPLLLFPAMEDFGTRPVFLATYLAFICFLIPIGLAQKFSTLIISRFFTGGCVQLLCNAVASIISNVFDNDRERSVPISLYVAVYLVSTSIGPVIGAAILSSLSWRWIGFIELIWTVALAPIFFFGLPESRGSVILSARARRLRREGKEAYTAEQMNHPLLTSVLCKSIQRPLYMLLTEPVVIMATLWAAFSLGTIYLFTQSVEQVYRQLYGFNSVQAGFVQLSVAIGELLGWILCIVTNRWYYASASRNTEVPGTPIPEARLYPSIIGGVLGVTSGMLTYGWSSYCAVPWIVPTIGLTLVGFGTTAVVVSIANYLIDAYSKYAASALGAVGLIENNSIAFLPFAAAAMYTNLGFHWASSLLALISLLLAATPLVVLKWGRQIRSCSPFMQEAIVDRTLHNAAAINAC